MPDAYGIADSARNTAQKISTTYKKNKMNKKATF